MTWNSIKSMLKIFKNKYFLFRSCQNKHKTKSKKLEKPKKEKLLLLIPENIGDKKLSVCKAVKYQLNVEKKV